MESAQSARRIPIFGSFRKLVFAVVIVAALAVSAFFVIRAFSFSRNEVVLVIEAEDSIEVGGEVKFLVTATNSSRTTMRDASLFFEFPQDTEVIGETGQFVRKEIGNIPSLEKRTFEFSARLHGDVSETKRMQARLSFRPSALSARFEVRAEKNVLLNALPIKLSLVLPFEVRSGQEFFLSLVAESRAEQNLEDLILEVTYPERFQFTDALPKPIEGETGVWGLSSLQSFRSEEFTVRGRLVEEKGGAVVFKARLGRLRDERFETLATGEKTLKVIPPRLTFVHRVKGVENPEYVIADPGETISGALIYDNSTDEVFNELVLDLTIQGRVADVYSLTSSEDFITPEAGLFRWSSRDVVALRTVVPGNRGEIAYSFRIVKTPPFNSFEDRNPSVMLRAQVMSRGDILAEQAVVAKLNSQINLVQQVLYNDAPGGRNSGPLPPRVSEETTYTVVWRVSGGTNGIRQARVRSVLGPSTSYLIALDPSAPPLAFDPESRELVWDLEDLFPGTGLLSPPRQVVFRIALRPQDQDIGTIPELLTLTKLTGIDSFTDMFLEQSLGAVNTELPDDGGVRPQDAVVQAGVISPSLEE